MVATDTLRPPAERLVQEFKFALPPTEAELREQTAARAAEEEEKKKAAAKPVAWSCEVCTFENPPALRNCEMCTAPKPANGT